MENFTGQVGLAPDIAAGLWSHPVEAQVTGDLHHTFANEVDTLMNPLDEEATLFGLRPGLSVFVLGAAQIHSHYDELKLIASEPWVWQNPFPPYNTIERDAYIGFSGVDLTLTITNTLFKTDMYGYTGQTTFTDHYRKWNWLKVRWDYFAEDHVVQHPLYGRSVLKVSTQNADIDLDVHADELLVNDQSLGGPFEIENLTVPQAELHVFTYNGAGIDAAFYAQVNIDRIALTHDPESVIDPVTTTSFNGIMAAETISGDPLPSYVDTVSPGTPIDTTTWVPNGYLKLGDTEPVWSHTFVDDPNSEDDIPTPTLYSFSLDVGHDSSSYIPQKWAIDSHGNYTLDPDGLLGDGSTGNPHLDNQRYDKAYIQARIPVSGSIRIKEINNGVNSLGPAALDNIRPGTFVYIEAPGRGIGNDPVPAYHE